jgi:predicted AAA+ superfamily ATPase
MEERLLTVLRIHNPWLENPSSQGDCLREGLPEPFLPRREVLDLSGDSARLVVGPRQAGKTTFIRHALSKKDDPVLLLHAEEPAVRELCRSPAEALEVLSGVLFDDAILLFEEIQHLDNASLFIKGLVDLQPRRRIIATGSTTFHFQAKIRESLAGRARRVRLLPFSLEEVSAALPKDMLPVLRERAVLEAWERILVFGGYPRPWFQADAKSELMHLVEAFVLKDASDFHSIEHPAAFRKLLGL